MCRRWPRWRWREPAISREELQQKLWPGASFGDPEHGLNAAINKLREKLGEAYSPDGTSIAFASTRNGTGAIWKCKADGTDPAKLASLQGLGRAPAWSPDGSRIAFDNRPGGRSRINVIGAAGGVMETRCRQLRRHHSEVVRGWQEYLFCLQSKWEVRDLEEGPAR